MIIKILNKSYSILSRQSRLTAYRQFVCWMFRGEKLRKEKRVVIPSCVIRKISQNQLDSAQD